MLESRISGPVAVIGDVHGQTDKLETLLDQLDERGELATRWVVFIGDLVDRGPDPCGTLELVAGLISDGRRVTVVSGNHELAMAGALGLVDAPESSNWKGRWLGSYGSRATFKSYGVIPGNCEELVAALPESHRTLVSECPWIVEHDDYLFVHSGLDPDQSINLQLESLHQRDLQLASPEWLFSRTWPFVPLPADCTRTVVSGHVPLRSVQMNDQRILVDTTGGTEGDLSCVLLPEREVVTSARRTIPFRLPSFDLRQMLGRRRAG